MTEAQEKVWLIAMAAAVAAAISGLGSALIIFGNSACIGLFRVARSTGVCKVNERGSDFGTITILHLQDPNAPTIGTVAAYGAALFSLLFILWAAVRLRTVFASGAARSQAEMLVAKQGSWSDLVKWAILVLLVPFIVFGGSVLLFSAVALVSVNTLAFQGSVASILVTVYMGAVAYMVTLWIGSFRAAQLNALAGIVFGIGIAGSALSTKNPEWWRVAISSLGMVGAGSEKVFDYALLLVALLFAAYMFDLYVKLRILHYVGRDQWPKHARVWMLIIGIVAALGISIVAIIDQGLVHAAGAILPGIVFVFTMTIAVGIPTLLRKHNRQTPAWLVRLAIVPEGFSEILCWVSVTLGGLVTLAAILFAIHEVTSIDTGVNLTGFEFITFASVVFWLYYFGVYMARDLLDRSEEEVRGACKVAFQQANASSTDSEDQA